MTNQTQSSDICCPPFQPELWENKSFEWNDKIFIKNKVSTILYMPLNFGSVMKKLDKKVSNAQADIPDYLCLSEHTSSWKMNVYLAVNKNIEGAENVTMSGKFYSKVYEGSFKETGTWMKDFDKTLKEKGLESKKTFMWYTTCPKCAKKYGKNYVAVIAQI